MPLPAATERTLLHTRKIACEGFERADGLWDIDGWMTDVKSYDVPNVDRGGIPAGTPVHGMGLRLTIGADYVIRDVVAVSDYTPFRMCPDITPNFRKLIGLKLGKGFNRAARELVGGLQGCVHLVELLGPMATVAFQTMGRQRRIKDQAVADSDQPRPPFLNTCHTWDTTSPVVKREFPKFYTGKD